MRTIKFRGIRLLSNDWEYGNLIQRPDGGHFIETGDLRLCPVQDFSIGQYTGLVDKNGKEIYEGDYVEVQKDGFGGVVTWHPHGYFYIKEPYKFKYDEEPDCLPIGEFIDNIKKQVTIVCNMYDNPILTPEVLNVNNNAQTN